MVTAVDVAKYIMEGSGRMTTMKLQKLVYYCQAWSLVRTGLPIFEDPIEAWAAGPVVRELYKAHRGRYFVDSSDIAGDVTKLAEAERKTVDKVVAFYGRYEASQLSDLTHSERPWLAAREGLSPTERGDRVIDPEVMFDFYTSLTSKRRVD